MADSFAFDNPIYLSTTELSFPEIFQTFEDEEIERASERSNIAESPIAADYSLADDSTPMQEELVANIPEDTHNSPRNDVASTLHTLTNEQVFNQSLQFQKTRDMANSVLIHDSFNTEPVELVYNGPEETPNFSLNGIGYSPFSELRSSLHTNAKEKVNNKSLQLQMTQDIPDHEEIHDTFQTDSIENETVEKFSIDIAYNLRQQSFSENKIELNTTFQVLTEDTNPDNGFSKASEAVSQQSLSIDNNPYKDEPIDDNKLENLTLPVITNDTCSHSPSINSKIEVNNQPSNKKAPIKSTKTRRAPQPLPRHGRPNFEKLELNQSNLSQNPGQSDLHQTQLSQNLGKSLIPQKRLSLNPELSDLLPAQASENPGQSDLQQTQVSQSPGTAPIPKKRLSLHAEQSDHLPSQASENPGQSDNLQTQLSQNLEKLAPFPAQLSQNPGSTSVLLVTAHAQVINELRIRFNERIARKLAIDEQTDERTAEQSSPDDKKTVETSMAYGSASDTSNYYSVPIDDEPTTDHLEPRQVPFTSQHQNLERRVIEVDPKISFLDDSCCFRCMNFIKSCFRR